MTMTEPRYATPPRIRIGATYGETQLDVELDVDGIGLADITGIIDALARVPYAGMPRGNDITATLPAINHLTVK